jgi:hypothetical protein
LGLPNTLLDFNRIRAKARIDGEEFGSARIDSKCSRASASICSVVVVEGFMFY